LFTENLWLAVAADDPLATSKAPARAADLQGRNFLTLDSGHRLTRITYALASTCGGLVSDEYAGTSLESILLMAATGTGIAILPELFAKRQAALRSEICLRPLQIDGADRELMLISRRQSADDDGAAMLAKVLNQTAAELGIEQT
jgi:LysR family hydrogen peroxide-inducible transcriptional activator